MSLFGILYSYKFYSIGRAGNFELRIVISRLSTAVRTRLYQREIAKIIDLVPRELKIEGLIRADDIGFMDFKKGINFDAFLLSAK
ncbi:DUF6934 family protein [Dyadobacter sp. CY323]|uniref:DUF6934 family protein n=1 Tax=Dyadobacter sp. CY323 TaxID=2907302 RepID=UPI0038D4CF23